MKTNKTNKSVLVVEDERPLQEAIKIKMRKSGFNVISAKSSNQALNYLRDESIGKIDAIWLDHYLLGRESGFDFLVKVKENPGWEDIPVFVVSNTASPEKVSAYLELGIDKYYVKSNSRLEQIIEDIKLKTETKKQ
ncbi:MAG: response regulator [Candidatus Moraniibacteriota bacterium]